MKLSKAKVNLEDGSKFMTLLNIGIKINVIIRELIKNTNLAINKGLKLELVLYMGYNRLFLVIYENIEIAIKEFQIRHIIFVIEIGDYDLVLGQLFLNFMKFNQKYKLDKIYDIITYLHTHQIDIFYILIS